MSQTAVIAEGLFKTSLLTKDEYGDIILTIAFIQELK
jgi:hypothetical protein